MLLRTNVMDWQIIGSGHQLTQRREIFGRKEIGQEVKIHSQQEKKENKRQFQDQWGDPVWLCWCTYTYINVYIGDIFCYMLLYIYQCILIYIDVYYGTYKYIYIERVCVKVNAHSLSEQLRESKSLYWEWWSVLSIIT